MQGSSGSICTSWMEHWRRAWWRADVGRFLSTNIPPGLSFRPPSVSRQRAHSSTMHPLPLLEGEPKSCAIRYFCFRQSPSLSKRKYIDESPRLEIYFVRKYAAGGRTTDLDFLDNDTYDLLSHTRSNSGERDVQRGAGSVDDARRAEGYGTRHLCFNAP